MASFSILRPVRNALRPSRLSPLTSRSFATPSEGSFASASTSGHSAAPDPSISAVDPGSGDALGIEEQDLPSNLVFEDGEVDITDDVVKMFERDGIFGDKEGAERSVGARMLTYGDTLYLPLSSLAERNPTSASSKDLAIPLPPTVFQQPLRRDILHRCVVYYLSLLRLGTASSKTRSEVAKSGRKLFRQKGTGKARAGSAGSGTRRGGGTIHGPHQRDFAQKLPRKVRQLGLHVALSSRLKSGLLRIVSDLGEGQWQTTRAARIALSDESVGGAAIVAMTKAEEARGLVESDQEMEGEAPEADETVLDAPATKFGSTKDLSILFVHGPDAPTTSLEIINRSVRNIPGVDVLGVEDLAAYEVLKRKWTVLDVSAVDWLAQRSGEPELFEDFEENVIDSGAAEESPVDLGIRAETRAENSPDSRERIVL